MELDEDMIQEKRTIDTILEQKDVCQWYKCLISAEVREKDPKFYRSYIEKGCDLCQGKRYYYENHERQERSCYMVLK